MRTPRSTLIAGTRSTNVTSVCQALAAMPLSAVTRGTSALPVLTVGCRGERAQPLSEGVLVEVAAEPNTVDTRADAAAQLVHGHSLGRAGKLSDGHGVLPGPP